jgi:hypothetical protein
VFRLCGRLGHPRLLRHRVSSALFSGACVSSPMTRDNPSTGPRARRRSRERSGPVWIGRPDTACPATGLGRVGPRASETVGRDAFVGQPSAAQPGVSSAFLLTRHERASAALPAAVLIKTLGAGEPLKCFWRSASVARGFDERAVGFAASATIDPTPVRRHPSLCSSNEADVIGCAGVAAFLAVPGASGQGSSTVCAARPVQKPARNGVLCIVSLALTRRLSRPSRDCVGLRFFVYEFPPLGGELQESARGPRREPTC